MANNVTLERIYSFFIARNLAESIEFYNQKLGFETDGAYVKPHEQRRKK